MALLNTIKHIKLTLKTISGYIKYMLTSDSIIMKSGKDLQTEINTINNRLSLQADYVIESKQVGYSVYRKWNSGRAELFTYAVHSGGWMQYPVPNLYYANYAFTIPNEFTFIGVDQVYGNIWSVGTNVGWVANIRVANNQILYAIVRNGNDGNTGVCAHVVGRWK